MQPKVIGRTLRIVPLLSLALVGFVLCALVGESGMAWFSPCDVVSPVPLMTAPPITTQPAYVCQIVGFTDTTVDFDTPDGPDCDPVLDCSANCPRDWTCTGWLLDGNTHCAGSGPSVTFRIVNPGPNGVSMTVNDLAPGLGDDPQIATGMNWDAICPTGRLVTDRYPLPPGQIAHLQILDLPTETLDCPWTWSIQGETLGARVDEYGNIAAGSETGTITVRATLKICSACFIETRLMIGSECTACKRGCGAGDGHCELGSIDVRFGLGKTAQGEPAGELYIYSKEPNAANARPEGLQYNLRRDGLNVQVFENSGVLHQVKTPDCLVTISTDGLLAYDSYLIRFYRSEDAGTNSGAGYAPTGDPYVVWNVNNPQSATNNDHLVVRRIVDNAATIEYLYDRNTSGGWKLTTNDPDGPTTVRREIEDWGTNGRTVTIDAGEGTDEAYKAVELYADPENLSLLLKRTVDPDGTDPQVTEIEYYGPDENGKRRIKWQKNPDGSWVWYLSYDGYGRKVQVVDSWNDMAFPSSEPAYSDAHAIVYSYVKNDDNDVIDASTQFAGGDIAAGQWEGSPPRQVTEYVMGVPVGRTFYAYYSVNRIGHTSMLRLY